jgi:hypothetical protein
VVEVKMTLTEKIVLIPRMAFVMLYAIALLVGRKVGYFRVGWFGILVIIVFTSLATTFLIYHFDPLGCTNMWLYEQLNKQPHIIPELGWDLIPV